jgi:hypothetical protein
MIIYWNILINNSFKILNSNYKFSFHNRHFLNQVFLSLHFEKMIYGNCSREYFTGWKAKMAES